MKFLRHLSWILRALLFAALFLFALKNTDPVTVRYYFGVAWQAPLVVVLLVIFVLGVAGGILATLGYVLRQRKEIGRLRRELALPVADGPAPESGV